MSKYCFPMPNSENPSTTLTPTFTFLKDYSAILLSGADTRQFLQGQVTCDIETITPTRGVIGAQCNLKGRVETAFVALAQEDDIVLLLPSSLAPNLIADLNKYALFSKVALRQQDDLRVWAANTLPTAALAAVNTIASVTCADIPQLGYMGVVLATDISDLQQQLQQTGLVESSACRWEADALAQGFCLIEADASASWTPHELNYDLIEAVNFKKGCYRGQEIVARVHYRGQTKVRGYGLKTEIANDVPVGTEVLDQNGVQIGKVVKSIICEDHTWLFSALNNERLATAVPPLRVGEQNGMEAQQCPQSYAIP